MVGAGGRLPRHTGAGDAVQHASEGSASTPAVATREEGKQQTGTHLRAGSDRLDLIWDRQGEVSHTMGHLPAQE